MSSYFFTFFLKTTPFFQKKSGVSRQTHRFFVKKHPSVFGIQTWAIFPQTYAVFAQT